MITSAVEILSKQGLYKESGRLAEQSLKTITASGDTAEHLMSEIDYYDLKTMGDQLDNLIAYMNPWVQHLYAKNAVAIANTVRVVNKESASGFKGAVGGGRQLDMLRFRPEQFQNPAAAGIAARTTWIRNIAAAPQTAQVICAADAGGADTHLALAMGTTEAIIILGFANPSLTPCSTAIQATYNAQAYNIQNMDYNLTQAVEDFALIELKEPIIVYPQEQILIQARYSVNGADELQPIGLWIKMSQNLRALANS